MVLDLQTKHSQLMKVKCKVLRGHAKREESISSVMLKYNSKCAMFFHFKVNYFVNTEQILYKWYFFYTKLPIIGKLYLSTTKNKLLYYYKRFSIDL